MMTVSRKTEVIIYFSYLLCVFIALGLARPHTSSDNDLCSRHKYCKNGGICQTDGNCICRGQYMGRFCEFLAVSRPPRTLISKSVQKRQSSGSNCRFPIKIESRDLPNGGGMSADYAFREFSGRVNTTNDINFNCNYGSTLRGALTINCGYDGTWELHYPVCDRTRNQQMSAFSNDPNQKIVARIECATRNVPAGSTVLVCYSPENCGSYVSACRAFTTVQSQSEPQTDGVTTPCRPGDTMQVTCPEGRRSRNYIRRCLESGIWTGDTPSCGENCMLPLNFSRSKVAMSGMSVNYRYQESSRKFTGVTDINFRCNSNYVVTGSLIISCTSYGAWDITFPECQRAYDSQISSNLRNEIVVRVECNAKSIPASQSIVACSSDGVCESGVSTCFASSPGSPVVMETGPPTFPFPSTDGQPSVQLPPSPPTRLPTPPRRPSTETTTKIFEPETVVTAVEITQRPSESVPTGFCPRPPSFPLGKYTITVSSSYRGTKPDGPLEVDTTLEYTCQFPYQIRGPSERICLASGDWSDQEPTCKPVCGIGVEPKTPQIINGVPAKVNGYPWQVAIKTFIPGSDVRDIVCGGVVMNEKWVLTAAHCITLHETTTVVSVSTYLLFFGKHYVDLNRDSPDVISRKVVFFVVHPNYNPLTLDSDLGLIALEAPLEFSEKILPVCLPLSSSPLTFKIGLKGLITGWGYVDGNHTSAKQLMMTELPIVSNDKCSESYQTRMLKTTVTENMFCAGYEQGGTGTCLGDSGGPMVFYSDGKYYLEGIVSWGNGENCAGAGYYGGYVRVRNYVHWIVKYVLL